MSLLIALRLFWRFIVSDKQPSPEDMSQLCWLLVQGGAGNMLYLLLREPVVVYEAGGGGEGKHCSGGSGVGSTKTLGRCRGWILADVPETGRISLQPRAGLALLCLFL